MHLTETRLADADRTADERAHLQSCVRCRLAARRLITFLDDAPPPIVAREPERYTAVRSLGAGGMSHVVLSVDGRLGREVARKKLRAVKSERDVERFVREAGITARLEHPNIVPVYDLEVDPQGSPTLTMRVIRGTSLGQAIRTGALPDRRARLEVFLKVCDAVAFAHSRGVIHRDLKPDNVMVGEFGEVQVVDFGLAAQEAVEDDGALNGDAALTGAGTVMGTPAYMSPEQARGEVDQVGPASDVYGLGAMLWEIATGRPPFAGEADAVVAMVALGRIPSPKEVDPSVPEDLAAIVLRAMATDPRDRYRDVPALRVDVVSFLAHAPVSARVPTIADRLAKWFARNRATVLPVVATAVLALLVLIVGLVAWARHATTARDQLAREAEAADIARAEALDALIEATLETGRRYLLDDDDPAAALAYFARLLPLVAGTPAEADARRRLSATLAMLPKVVAILPVSPPVYSVALDRPGRRVVIIDDRTLVRSTETGEMLAVLPHAAGIAAGWSPSGERLALANSRSALVLDGGTYATVAGQLVDDTAVATQLEWAPDGSRFRVVCMNDAAYPTISCPPTFFDGTTARLGSKGPPGSVDVSFDGSTTVSMHGDRATLRAGTRTWHQQVHRRYPHGHLSPDATRVLLHIADKAVAIVDMTTGGPTMKILEGSGSQVYWSAWSGSGDAVATADRDGHVRAWSAESQDPLTPPLPTGGQVWLAAWSGDDEWLAGGGGETEHIRVWQLPVSSWHAPPALSLRTPTQELWLEDDQLHWIGEGGEPHLTAVVEAAVPSPCQRGVIALDASRRFASVACQQGVTIVDLLDGPTWSAPHGHLAWNQTHPFLAIAAPGDLWIWSPDRGLQRANLGAKLGLEVSLPIWSPDGSQAAAEYPDGIIVIDAETLERVMTIETPLRLRAWTTHLGMLAVDDASTVFRVPLTGAEPMPVLHVDTNIDRIAASDDGLRLALTAGDGTLRVWDIAREAFVGGVHASGDHYPRVAFTSDSRYIVTVGYYTHRTIVWTRDGELVAEAPPSMVDPPTVGPQFADLGGLEPDSRPIEDWLDVATLYSQRDVRNPTGEPPTLEDLQALWEKLRVLYPDEVGVGDDWRTERRTVP